MDIELWLHEEKQQFSLICLHKNCAIEKSDSHFGIYPHSRVYENMSIYVTYVTVPWFSLSILHEERLLTFMNNYTAASAGHIDSNIYTLRKISSTFGEF